jgi:hypothetical protein
MSARTTICEQCGNEISRWDNGVCVHCLSKGHYENLGAEWTPDFPKQPSATNIVRKVDIDRIIGTDWRVWLDAFNRLLADIYWKNMRFSQILRNSGITDDKIITWKRDSTWLVRFFNSLEKKISTIVVSKFSEKEYDIFKAIYGIGYKGAKQVYEVAEEHNISVQEAIAVRQKVIQFLKGWNIKTEFESAIFQSAVLANDMRQIYQEHSYSDNNNVEEAIEFDDNEFEEYINLFEVDNEDDEGIY